MATSYSLQGAESVHLYIMCHLITDPLTAFENKAYTELNYNVSQVKREFDSNLFVLLILFLPSLFKLALIMYIKSQRCHVKTMYLQTVSFL